MHKWTIRDNRQWYGWWRCDDFIRIFESGHVSADQWGHVGHVSGWRHSVSPPGAACHPLSRSSSKNFLPPGPAKWFLHPWRLLAPLRTPHELWQYPGNIYLTKANNRSTLQSREQRVSGTREFNNWFNASLHIKAKDFAKRCGQKQPSVHYIICRAADTVHNEKFQTKRAKLL